MTANIRDKRSFAIKSPNEFKVGKYYHIRNLVFWSLVLNASVRLVPKVA